MSWVGVVRRSQPGYGRNKDKTYVNVITSVTEVRGDANSHTNRYPDSVWANPAGKEFIVDLPTALAHSLQGNQDLYHSGFGNLPKWQQEHDGSGSALSYGSFADPEDSGSVFTASTPLSDDRLILRIYDGDPGSGGTHVGDQQLPKTASTTQTYYAKLFDESDVAMTFTGQEFLYVSAQPLFLSFTSGVAAFQIDLESEGAVRFPSYSNFRVVQPGGNDSGQMFYVASDTLYPRITGAR